MNIWSTVISCTDKYTSRLFWGKAKYWFHYKYFYENIKSASKQEIFIVVRKLSHHNNLLPSFIYIIIVCNIYLVWNQADLGALPIFCNHLLFSNHLKAGDFSISLASSKSWVSPLKAFAKFKNLTFHYQAFIICKNEQSLKMCQCIKK